MPLPSGTRIGPYEISGLLGAGGMGEVYRARDTRLNRDVALKRLSNPELAADVAGRRVLHEARAAGALSHSNIAAIHDVLETPDGLVIVMEYVAGESLASRLSRGPLSQEQALNIARQVADALAEAHDRGIVHRDLKPANIIVDDAGRPKILDFGIARSQGVPSADPATQHPTLTAQMVGTPGYMAPEQLAGAPADARTDIYALGLLLFEMLTGRRPFEARDYLDQAMAVFQRPTPQVSEFAPVSPAVNAVVARAMARQPDERFANARDLSDALTMALRDISTAKTGPQRPPSAVGWWKSRAAAIGVTVVLVAIAMLLVLRPWQHRTAVPSVRSRVIGVLPFRNETGNAADAALVVGLSDSVEKRLASVRPLRVLPLEETRAASRDQPDPQKLARLLGAGYIVDGALQRAGDALAVRVSLVSDNGAHLDAGQFNGRADRLLDLHRQVTNGVITALRQEGIVPDDAAVSLASVAPTTNQDAYAEYAQARAFLERPDVPGNLDRAITLFKSAIGKDNRFALAHAGLGEAYWAQYNETKDPAWTAKAQAANLEALRINAELPEVRMALAIMYEGSGRRSQAREELQQVIALQPENDTAYRLLAKMNADTGQWDQAIAEARQAITLRPNYWANHSELGDILRAAGRFAEAAAAYTRLTELQPDSARAYQRLGTSLQEAGRFDEAVAAYRKAETIRPSAAVYSNLGALYHWRGDFKAAAEWNKKAIALAPNQPDPYGNLGDALMKMGQVEAAKRNYELAIQQVRKQLSVNDKDGYAVVSLALFQAKLGLLADAKQNLARALTLAPDDGDVLANAASIHALARESNEACAKLTAALARGSSRVTARHTDEFAILGGCPAYQELVKTTK